MTAIKTGAARSTESGATMCPRCSNGGRLTLLTSMTEYFGCDHCGWRWMIAVGNGRIQAVTPQVDLRLTERVTHPAPRPAARRPSRLRHLGKLFRRRLGR